MRDSIYFTTNTTLYHGSIYLFDKVDASMGKPFKDFGRGFYTTQNRNHAVNMALRNKKIEEIRLRRKEPRAVVVAYLYTYDMLDAEESGDIERWLEV